MIDLNAEEVFSLTEATKRLPARRQGKRPNLSTLWRWATSGCRGIKLETIRVGATLCTSAEALQRFCERLTDPSGTPTVRATKQRQRQIDEAKARVAAAGL